MMRQPRLRLCLAFSALFMLLATVSIAQDSDPEISPEEFDRRLLEAYRSGEREIFFHYWSIHDNPRAGQRATFANAEGSEVTFHVAFVRGAVCTVEEQLRGTKVVIAVEVEVDGPIKNKVRRGWVGLVGSKPTQITVPPPEPATGAVGLGGNSGRFETTREPFVDVEQGGRKWSGHLRVYKRWEDSRRQGGPELVTKTWESTEGWFNQAVRVEKQYRDQKPEVSGLVSCSDNGKPLLDWSDVPPPTEAQDAEIRKPVIDAVARADLGRLIRGGLELGAQAGLHPNAEVGDWAEYGNRRHTLVALSEDRAVVEVRTLDGRNLCHALEFHVADGKAGGVVACYAGIKGEQPTRAAWREFRDLRESSVETGKLKTVTVAGAEWEARDVRESRISFHTGEIDEVKELLVSETAPFAQPLRLKSYRVESPHQAYTKELTAFGDGGKAALDWSEWKPAQAWKAPFTVDQVKAFIRVGMKWKYKQEIETEDGLAVFIQHWEVTEVDEHGYKCLCKSEGPDNLKAEVTDHLTWDGYIARIELIAQGNVSERELKLNDRTIKVVLFKGKFFRRDVLFGLSPDLPGVRICTEEDLGGASRVWLTEFHDPPAEKKDD